MAPRRAAALRDGGDQSLREHLIATAERLIARRGTVGLTVREIAREARVADGVLYNHFSDKDELLALAALAHVRAVDARLGPPPPPGSGAVAANLSAHLDRNLALHAAVLPVFAGLLGQPGVLAQVTTLSSPAAGGRELRDELAEYLRAEQRLGRLPATANVDAAATMLNGACHELVLPQLFSGATPSELKVPPRFVADLVETVLNGIGQAT